MARWQNALRSKEEVHRIKRDAVLRESGRVFSQRGFHNSSLAEVAKRLDVSKATLYNYVKDKQEILYEFHKMALAIGRVSLDIAEARQGSGRDRLASAISEYITRATDELGGYGVITEVKALRPQDRDVVIEQRDALEARLVRLIEAGIEDGSLRRLDAKIAIATFMSTLQTIPSWYSPLGRLTGREIAERITDLLIGGIRARADRRPSRKSGQASAEMR